MFRNLVATLFIASLSVPTAAADDGKDPDDWKFLIEPYGWIPSVPLTAANGESLEIDKKQIINNLKGAVMLVLGARKNEWSFYLDTVYFNMEGTDHASAQAAGLPGNPNLGLDLDITVKGWFMTGYGTYAVVDNSRTRLELGAGLRFYNEELEYTADINRASSSAKYKWNLWDGVVAARGFTNLTDRWYASYYADASKGGTDLTYQLAGALNYRFDKFTVVGGYRYVKWKFDEGSDAPGSIARDQTAKGPFLGLKFIL